MATAAQPVELTRQVGSKKVPLRTLERTDVDSDTLIIFLHGLGLDADDYLPYLRASHQRCVAVTLYGFDRGSTPDAEPASFEQHAEYLSALVAELQREHPTARLVLVGFSLGADMIIRLADFWAQHSGEPARVAAAVLLDPNINHSTMTISRVLANADPADPLSDLKQIATLPASMASFQAIITYLGKILGKDMRHLHRLSTDAVNYWQPDGYELFGKRIATVKHFARHVRVLMSDDYRPHLEALQELQDDQLTFTLIPGSDHFDLIGAETLKRALDHHSFYGQSPATGEHCLATALAK